MSDEPLDDETVAAFLDGTLAPDERARVLRVLAADPDRYADFLEAVNVSAALKEEVPQTPGVIPLPVRAPRPWKGRFFVAVPLLVAAGIAGVLVVSPDRSATDAIAILQESTRASSGGSGSIGVRLGAQWDEPGWSVTRGGESADASPGTVARIGARVAQLELAARARDTVAYQQVLATLQRLIDAVSGASPIAARLAGLPMDAAGARATAVRQLREVAGASSAFDAGALLEAARLAFASGNGAFFAADGEGLRALRAASAALERAPPAGDWTTTRAQMRTIVTLDAIDAAEVRARVDSALAAIPK